MGDTLGRIQVHDACGGKVMVRKKEKWAGKENTSMSAQQNKALARRFMDEVWNKGNLNFIDEVTDPNFVSHDPAGPEDMGGGVEGAKQFVEMYRNAFPDTQMSVEDVIAEGDKVVTRWTVRATHQGELMGIPPSGNRVELTGISIDRIEGGKFVETWSNYDALGMMQQLGVMGSSQEHSEEASPT